MCYNNYSWSFYNMCTAIHIHIAALLWWIYICIYIYIYLNLFHALTYNIPWVDSVPSARAGPGCSIMYTCTESVISTDSYHDLPQCTLVWQNIIMECTLSTEIFQLLWQMVISNWYGNYVQIVCVHYHWDIYDQEGTNPGESWG